MRVSAPRFVFLCIATVVCSSAQAQAQEAEAISQAKAASSSWLALVDAGDYQKSWQQSANLFQGAVTPQAWASAAQAVRAPLGPIQSRSVESATYTDKLPGAPDGKYVVIKYKSIFAHKASAVETVTSLNDKDGSWRVSGYYVR